MASRSMTLASLAAVSIVLGGWVCAPSGATPIADPPVEVAATPVTPATNVVPLAATKSVAVSVDRPTRPQIPVGCDRLVSVLARSTASRQIGRCLT